MRFYPDVANTLNTKEMSKKRKKTIFIYFRQTKVITIPRERTIEKKNGSLAEKMYKSNQRDVRKKQNFEVWNILANDNIS